MANPKKKQPGPRKSADRSAPKAVPAKENKTPLTGLETEIMQVVWRLGTVSAAEVREALSPDRPLARTTILTVLENLRKKKAVRVVPTVGREKKFRAGVAKETIAGQLLGSLRGRFFNGSAASLVAHLIKNGDVDKRELEEIREVIERSKTGGSEPKTGGSDQCIPPASSRRSGPPSRPAPCAAGWRK